MTWNFKILRENAPLGFKSLETHCFYYGSPPATKFPNMVGIDNYLEIPKHVWERTKNPGENVLIVMQGTRGSERFYAYHPDTSQDSRKLSMLYEVLRKLSDGWYREDSIPDIETILKDEREFTIDQKDFGYFEKTLTDKSLTLEARHDLCRKTGDILALAYLDFLRENFELRTSSKVDHKNMSKLYKIIKKYIELKDKRIEEPSYR